MTKDFIEKKKNFKALMDLKFNKLIKDEENDINLIEYKNIFLKLIDGVNDEKELKNLIYKMMKGLL